MKYDTINLIAYKRISMRNDVFDNIHKCFSFSQKEKKRKNSFIFKVVLSLKMNYKQI